MSAAEPIHSDVKSKPQLACFRISAEFMQKPHIADGPDDYRLAHGNLATLPQDAAVNHAWIEEIDFVYELSKGHKFLFSKDDYYKKTKFSMFAPIRHRKRSP